MNINLKILGELEEEKRNIILKRIETGDEA